MDQEEFTALARHNGFLANSIFGSIEGATLISLTILELLLAKGLLDEAETTAAFKRLSADLSDRPEGDPARFAVDAALKDVELGFESGSFDAERVAHRRRFGGRTNDRSK